MIQKFEDQIEIPGRASFAIVEDIRSPLYRILEPCFKLKISCPANIGERVRKALDSSNLVYYWVPGMPDEDGWMDWDVKLSFKVGADPGNPEGRELRQESISFAWARILGLLTEAVMGTPDPKPTGKVIHVRFGPN